MSTRLYIDANPAVLEKLANVPKGTYQKWLIYSAAMASMKNDDMDTTSLAFEKEVDEFDYFMTFGFGKFNKKVRVLLKTLNLDPGWDGTDIPSIIENILKQSGLLKKLVDRLGPNYLEKIQGLAWD